MEGTGGFKVGSGDTKIVDHHPSVESICATCSFGECVPGCKEFLNGADK